MPIYDQECVDCGYEFEERRKSDVLASVCPSCGGKTKVVWHTVPILDKAKNPYDYLDGRIPDPKPIKSFARDHRRGGKNTV